jgi:putative SOS response-associated peptidase YedK
MCSRYSLTSPPEAVRALFNCAGEESFPPRFNIAPTDPVLIVRSASAGNRELTLVRWGLLPPWVKDPREFATLINARAESVTEKPSFRGAIRHRRCLVPTDGFYEWTGRPGAKQPHRIGLKGGHLFAMAGLWEHWLGADGSEIETMAVILKPDDYQRWLDCQPGTADHVIDLLTPLPDGEIEIRAVNPKLNNPRSDGPELLNPPASSPARLV